MALMAKQQHATTDRESDEIDVKVSSDRSGNDRGEYSGTEEGSPT